METVYTAKVPGLFGDAELRLGAESNVSGVNISVATILVDVLECMIVSASHSKCGPCGKIV